MARISIVIPTKDRGEFLKEAIKTALPALSDDIELVVSNNHSADETGDVLAQYAAHPHVIVTKPDVPMSMRGNFENGLKAATGDYILFMGDDDGVLPTQMKKMPALLDAIDTDCLYWPLQTFTWPMGAELRKQNLISVKGTAIHGRLSEAPIAEYKGNLVRCDNKHFKYFPRSYHGLVSRRFMEKHTLQNGQFYNGSVPDIFVSYLLVLAGARCHHLNHPVTLNGAGPKSTGSSVGQAGEGKSAKHSSAVAFRSEHQTDPYGDEIEPDMSIALALYASAEQCLKQYPEFRPQVSLENWMSFVATDSTKKDPEVAKRVDQKVMDSMRRNYGRVPEVVNRAYKAVRPKNESLSKFLSLFVRRNVAPPQGRNATICDAAMCLDRILGDDPIDATGATRVPWRETLKRIRQVTTS